MVAAVEELAPGQIRVEVLLTIAGCPLKGTLERDVTAAVVTVPGVSSVRVDLGVMSDQQRVALRDQLRGGQTEREIPFSRPDSLTQVIAVASGKGGVGKSSVTVEPRHRPGGAGRTGSGCSTPTSTATRCRPCSGWPTPARRRSRT